MRLRISPTTGTVHADGLGELLLYRRYPIDSHHDIIVTSTDGGLNVKVKRGSATIREGVVPLLSDVVGGDEEGQLLTADCIIDVDPATVIFPQGAVVKRLLALGAQPWQISPLYDPRLILCLPCTPDYPQVQTDGMLELSAVPKAHKTLGQLMRVTITAPSWVVVSYDQRLTRVYLWEGAERHADVIATEVQRLRPGAAVS